MKKKVVTSTYLRETTKHQLRIFYDEDDSYVSVKKLINITEPFIIKNNVIAMDNGYYIVEIIPKKGNYALRIFLDDKKKVVEYYFDIIKESGLTEDNVPYFIDLYLDITIDKYGEINIIDENELEMALDNEDITKDDYDLAIKIKEQILNELSNNTCLLMKKDISKYIEGM